MEKFAKDRTEQIRTIPAAFGPLLFLGVLLIVRDRTGAEKTGLTLEAQDTIEIAEQTGAVKAPDKIKQQASTNKPANISKLVDVAPSGKFFVFAPGYEESSRSALLEALLGKATKMSMKSIETLADLRADDPGVLVIALGGKDFKKLGSYKPDELKRRKVIGIGYGAAKLFADLGLAINGGQCAHGVIGEPQVSVVGNKTLAGDTVRSPVPVFNPPILDATGFHNDLFFGLYVGDGKLSQSGVDIVALQTADSKYAPIARQGNEVLVCVDAPADKWSNDFRKLVGEVAAAIDSHTAVDEQVKLPESEKP
jgi:hypothetical protein